MLMYWHNFHRSNIPVYFAISYEVFVCVFYFVAAYATNMGALRGACGPRVSHDAMCQSLTPVALWRPQQGARCGPM